jgi:hypothetical protein
MEPRDAAADRLDHAPHLAVAALVEDELEPVSGEAPNLCGGGRPVVQLDARREPLELGVAERAVARNLVHLVHLVPGMREPV